MAINSERREMGANHPRKSIKVKPHSKAISTPTGLPIGVIALPIFVAKIDASTRGKGSILNLLDNANIRDKIMRIEVTSSTSGARNPAKKINAMKTALKMIPTLLKTSVVMYLKNLSSSR